MTIKSLTWALVIATYRREAILPLCLRLAACQTRSPKEIIVVDASPNWQEIREQITQEFLVTYPQIHLTYVQAEQASSATQRNQGIGLSSADVLFLIDDDSLMYPDCAEEIMKVYEADVPEVIKGVGAINVSQPPEMARKWLPTQTTSAVTSSFQSRQSRFRQLAKSLLSTKATYFLPYDEIPPVHTIPPHLYSLNIGVIEVMAGFAMTFRRSILQKERFSEVLRRYAAGEDQDLSYRVSRHGAIVNAVNARLCHLELSSGRLSKYQVAALAALNPSVLQQFYSPNRDRINRRWRQILWHRVLIYLLKDISERNWRFSRMRGVLFALSHLHQIYTKSPDELSDWYPEFQKQFLST
jgi:GT2 family glycosyltransferase